MQGYDVVAFAISFSRRSISSRGKIEDVWKRILTNFEKIILVYLITIIIIKLNSSSEWKNNRYLIIIIIKLNFSSEINN